MHVFLGLHRKSNQIVSTLKDIVYRYPALVWCDVAKSDSPHRDEQGLQAQGSGAYVTTQGALANDLSENNEIKNP